MKCLNVIYDADCALCRRCREWLHEQPAFLTLTFTPLQALDLEDRFPGIGQYQPREQLIVISDEGGVYVGGAAWIMCLYALEDYRELSVHLARPGIMPFARRVCELISHNRLTLSRALRLTRKDRLPDALPFRPPSRHRSAVQDCEAGCKL
jgi:predicted DCC family thiol-disulfide oxidoreductase YuxK